MRKIIIFLICYFQLVLLTSAQITVSTNGRFLTTKDGKPFFWLGDTDWEMFHRLTREEIADFIEIRSRQGFNVLQAVALAEFQGLHQPNRYGDMPLINDDPTQLATTPGNTPSDKEQYDYWDHVDYVIDLAASKGIYIGLLPTWGDKVAHLWGDGPIIFNEENAKKFAALLAKRYSNRWNVIWILGGDRPAVYKTNNDKDSYDDRPIWRAMAEGIQEVLGKDTFITYHPSGGSYSTSQYLHNESWLSMNAFQSGHGSREADAWNWVERDLKLSPQKPTLDMEPCYEDHPVNPWDGKWTRQRGYFNAYDVRARIYRSVFAGACGVTYGHHQIWQFLNKELYEPVNIGDTLIGWRTAAKAEAATQMIHLKNLMLSRPFSRMIDQSLIKSDAGKDYIDQIIATRDQEGSYAFVYVPQSKSFKVDLTKLSGKTKNVWWYDPRTGNATRLRMIKVKNGVLSATPPSLRKDWVLVIDDASKKYPVPATF
jgi:Protein of unknown function (DUF4038)/Putative collagen-binding domain of a collagenase